MSGNKIFGFILMVFGLLIILWGLYSSYNIFRGKTALPQVFNVQELEGAKQEDNLGGKTLKNLSPEEIQENMQKTVQEQLEKVFPPGIFTKLLNLISWSIFAWILIFGGGKIASLGITLLKQ